MPAIAPFAARSLEACPIDAVYPNHTEGQHVRSGAGKEEIPYACTLSKGHTEEKSCGNGFHWDLHWHRLHKHRQKSTPEMMEQRAAYQLAMRLVQDARNSPPDPGSLHVLWKALKKK